MPNRVERAKTSRRPIGEYVEFCKYTRMKFADEPIGLMAMLTSTFSKSPRLGSDTLLRRSRTQFTSNSETSVFWLNSGISSTAIWRLLATTCRYTYRYRIELLEESLWASPTEASARRESNVCTSRDVS